MSVNRASESSHARISSGVRDGRASTGMRRQLLRQNLLDVRLKRQAAGLGLGRKFIGDVDRNHHRKTLPTNRTLWFESIAVEV